MGNIHSLYAVVAALGLGVLGGIFLQYHKIPSRLKWAFLDLMLKLTHRRRFDYSASVDPAKLKVFGNLVEFFDPRTTVHIGSTKPEKSWMNEREFLSYRYYWHFKEISDYLVSDKAKSIASKLRSDFWGLQCDRSNHPEDLEPKRTFLKAALGIKDLPVNGKVKERRVIADKDGLVIEKLSLESRIPDISVPLYTATPKKGKARGVVIALHGIASVPEKVMGLEPPDYTRQFGLELARQGFAVCAPFIINLHDRPANISGLGMLYTGNTHWSIELQKLLSVADFIKGTPDLASLPLIVYGISLGGLLALMLAAVDKRIDVIVSSAAMTRNPNEFDYAIEKQVNKINYALISHVNKIVYFRYSDYARLIYPRPLIVEMGALDNPIGDVELWPEIEKVYSKNNMQDNLKLIYFKGFHETVPELVIPALAQMLFKK